MPPTIKTIVLGPPDFVKVEGDASLLVSFVVESIVVVLLVAHEGFVRTDPAVLELTEVLAPAQVAGRSSTGGGSFYDCKNR